MPNHLKNSNQKFSRQKTNVLHLAITRDRLLNETSSWKDDPGVFFVIRLIRRANDETSRFLPFPPTPSSLALVLFYLHPSILGHLARFRYTKNPRHRFISNASRRGNDSKSAVSRPVAIRTLGLYYLERRESAMFITSADASRRACTMFYFKCQCNAMHSYVFCQQSNRGNVQEMQR